MKILHMVESFVSRDVNCFHSRSKLTSHLQGSIKGGKLVEFLYIPLCDVTA